MRLEGRLGGRPHRLSGRDRIGEYLLYKQKVNEQDLYHALSLQAGIPLGLEDKISRAATRALPAATARRWKVVPYRVAQGQLHVLTSEIPSERDDP